MQAEQYAQPAQSDPILAQLQHLNEQGGS